MDSQAEFRQLSTFSNLASVPLADVESATPPVYWFPQLSSVYNPFLTPDQIYSQKFPRRNIPLFPRPADGAVDGFIKFHWSKKRRQPSPTSSTILTMGVECDGNEMPETTHTGRDRLFWDFYIRNWCPGRSLLRETNPWETSFIELRKFSSVEAAICSFIGTYLYDYVPTENIYRRIIQNYKVSEKRLIELYESPQLMEDKADELLTVASILAMQDIITTEYQQERSYSPSWFYIYQDLEKVLQTIHGDHKFMLQSNTLFSPLRLSHTVIVGLGIIITQTIMPLPSPSTLNPQEEVTRFGWLLSGAEKDIYEIHGGCGFSRKLLHIISQITYCAARLYQDPQTPIPPLTLETLYNFLRSMRQWSRESQSLEQAQKNGQPIEWVYDQPEGYVIKDVREMIDITAEAWRLAAMVYLQCRGLRLPRGDPRMIKNLSDLAMCIRIMPTSGKLFTAQAPLFPVFLLGMLTVNPEHRDVSRNWFESVVRISVRSTVPRVYDALKRVWQWVDKEARKTTTKRKVQSTSDVYLWWEAAISIINAPGPMLCLT